MINEIKDLNLPIIVGGGIKSVDQIREAHSAGANLVVIGNKLEKDTELLLDIHNYKSEVLD